MFTFLQKKSATDANTGAQVTFTISGMHCTSCSMSIDDELEDTKGVISAKTSYAKARTEITYDPTKITPEKLKEVVEALEYRVSEKK